MRINLSFQWSVTIINHNNPHILDCLCASLTKLENWATIVLSCHTAVGLVGLEHQAAGANGNVPPGRLHTPDVTALDMSLFNPGSYRSRGNWTLLFQQQELVLSAALLWAGQHHGCLKLIQHSWALNLNSEVVAIQFPLLSMKQNHPAVPLATLGVQPCPKDCLPKC